MRFLSFGLLIGLAWVGDQLHPFIESKSLSGGLVPCTGTYKPKECIRVVGYGPCSPIPVYTSELQGEIATYVPGEDLIHCRTTNGTGDCFGQGVVPNASCEVEYSSPGGGD